MQFVKCSEAIMKLATNVARENLISLGTCIGKFTKTKKFKLHITALDVIAPLAKVSKHSNITFTFITVALLYSIKYG